MVPVQTLPIAPTMSHAATFFLAQRLVWDRALHVVVTALSRAPSARVPVAGSSDSRAPLPVLSSGESTSARRYACPGRRVRLLWNLPENNPNVTHRRLHGGEGPRRQPPCLKFTFTAEVGASSSFLLWL